MILGARMLMGKRMTTRRRLGVTGCGRASLLGILAPREPNSHTAWGSTYTWFQKKTSHVPVGASPVQQAGITAIVTRLSE
jgi:hypothetical protein